MIQVPRGWWPPPESPNPERPPPRHGARADDRPSDLPSDLELMELADGERDNDELAARIERDPEARAKREAIHQIGELVRGHLELSADAVHDAKFAAMWRRIDGQLVAPATGLWSRVGA